MKRLAKCHCGALQVTTTGEPTGVFMCHCTLCQRRTGTSYNLGAWFPRGAVSIEGETKQYVRKGESGADGVFHFCPTCGTNICWEAPEILPGAMGVAVGCFADPGFPRPILSAYEDTRHRWLPPIPEVPGLPGGPPDLTLPG
jgi:hypothetical protein